jgi:hypothetical protein
MAFEASKKLSGNTTLANGGIHHQLRYPPDTAWLNGSDQLKICDTYQKHMPPSYFQTVAKA